MQITEQKNQYLHSKLPIDNDEKILAIYRHHWFAYASSWILGGFIVIVIMALAIAFTALAGSDGAISHYKGQIIGAAAAFSVLVLLGTCVPVYLRSQEQLVLTEESLLQMLRPSLFANKIDQVGLTRVDDISTRQDFLGSIFGYGHLTVETPGEQDNYEFYVLPSPHVAAREITEAKENYDAALQGGRMHTTLGEAPAPQAPQVDPAQYQQFLAFQQAQAAAAQQNQAANQVSVPPQTPQPDPQDSGAISVPTAQLQTPPQYQQPVQPAEDPTQQTQN